MIYTVTLNPSLDYVVKVNNFQAGQVNRAEEAEIIAGGKGINVSTILTRLDTKSVALGYVAGFTGRKIVDEVNNMGVAEKFTWLGKGDSRINVKIRGNGVGEINAAGPNITTADERAFMDNICSLVQDGDYVVLAGSIPKSLGSDTYFRIMTALSNHEVNFVVDAEGALLCDVLQLKPFLIKPNVHELGAIFKRELKNSDDVRECALALQRRGARNVLVSMGAEGAVLFSEDGQEIYEPAMEGEVVNTVGAGDSMVAGFLYGHIQFHDYKKALHWGSACGNATAFSLGIAERELILSLL